MQINAREKVEAALDAINRHGDAINGMITVTEDLAREAADEADRAAAEGRWLGLCTAYQWRSRTIFKVLVCAPLRARFISRMWCQIRTLLLCGG